MYLLMGWGCLLINFQFFVVLRNGLHFGFFQGKGWVGRGSPPGGWVVACLGPSLVIYLGYRSHLNLGQLGQLLYGNSMYMFRI
jgi:hypothetical protein